VERTDRRTFLSSGAKAAATLAAAGALSAVDASASGADIPAAATDATATSGGSQAPKALTVNGLVAPVGIDPDDVYFAWQLDDARRGARQSAYQVVVSRPGLPGKVWDSGKVRSDEQAFIPCRAPHLEADTAYAFTVRTADAAGHWSPTASGTFVTGLRQADWRAQWLSPGPAGPVDESYTYLRTVVHPSGSPVVRAIAYVAAAHKYQLHVGGRLAGAGPSFSYPDEQYVQATDVTHLVRAGRPTVLGVLHKWYGPGQGRPASSPGVLLQLSVHHADGSREVFGTDGTWRQHAAEWLPGAPRNTEGDFTENIDGRLAPLGWDRPEYDDTPWTPTPVIGPAGTAPFTALVAQRTAISEEVVRPVAVHTLASGAVVADFGKVYAARPRVRFTSGVAGRPVNLYVGYLLDRDGSVSTTHGTQGTDLSFSYVQRDGDQVFLPYTFLGWRYLQIDDPGEPLGAGDIAALARHATMPEHVALATFASSAPMLDKVWELCTHSCLYASHEQFVDTPTREKGQFLWDSANDSEAVMRAYGEQNLTWQALRDFHRSQRRYFPNGLFNTVYPNGDGARALAEFGERYPEWLWRYYLATGDRATVAAHYPAVRNLANYVATSIDPATGLVTSLQSGGTDAGSNFIDGPPAMLYGYDTNVAAVTTTNMLSVNVFRRATQMADLLGDTAGQAAMTAAATALTTAVNAHLLGSGGVYIDGLRADGTQSTHASQQANALALAYGVVPSASVAAVGRHVASLAIRSGPPHGLELARAYSAAGLDAELVRALTDPHHAGYAHIVAVGGTFTWESWTPSDLNGDSMSHGWGSSLLVAIHEALLGVVPAGPRSFDVSPPTGGLTAARGSFPTVAGRASVDWRRRGGRLSVAVELPPNTVARVHLPAASAGRVTESGHPLHQAPGVESVTTAHGVTTVAIGAGRYSFSSPVS
jgi:alpha-L-rhamnosidase